MRRYVKGGEKYRLYSSTGFAGESRGGKPILSQASGSAYTVTLTNRNMDDRTPLVGLGGAWQPMPRKPAPLSTNQKVYLAAVADVLKQHGLQRATPHIEKILRVESGRQSPDFVVIEAASPGYSLSREAATGKHQKNDYSFVLLRTLSHGAVHSYVLNGDFGHKDATELTEKYGIAGVLDLNGDGILEIVVETSYYEGGGDEVYEVKSGRPKRVLQVEDGA